MDRLIEYEKAKKLKNFNIPKDCPKCSKMWKPEPLPLTLMQEGWFGAIRMAQLYAKQCEFCGHTYRYYA